MKKMLLIMSALVMLTGCSGSGNIETEDPAVEIAGSLTVDKMQWLRITPTVRSSGDAVCRWLLDGKEISETVDLLYVFAASGSYTLEFRAKNDIGETVKTVAVTVKGKTYQNAVFHVYDYCPAPGQFINAMPAGTAADTPETMRQKAHDALTNDMMICLGGFGGYVVFGFDHTVINREGNDFIVHGNAHENSSEPGVIMVSCDVNGNGLPDDEWFEIAGSEYDKPSTVKNYEITYYKPETEPATPNELQYIRWTDNRGQQGWIAKNMYHRQTYYPLWLGASYTLKGTLMESNIYDASGNGTYWINIPYDRGYADNWGNTDVRAQIDIDWAVDSNGNPVKLKGIDFVKVYTGNRAECGWLGEVSTETGGFTDLNLK